MIDRSLSDPDLEGTVRVVSASATHVGHVRATNEDSLLTATPIHLVADGMEGTTRARSPARSRSRSSRS